MLAADIVEHLLTDLPSDQILYAADGIRLLGEIEESRYEPDRAATCSAPPPSTPSWRTGGRSSRWIAGSPV